MSPHIVHSRARDKARWSEATDLELLSALAERADEAAFDELVERKAAPLGRLAGRMVRDAEEARDIVQLTFLRVWENRRRFNPRWSPNTWLYRIATNLAIDHLRSQRGRRQRSEPFRHHLYEVHASRRHRDLARLDEGEIGRILDELSGGLTERQRMVFLLREVEDMSSREVAEVLGCRESTVRNHLFTARKHLRAEMLRRFPEYTPERLQADDSNTGESA